MLISVCFSFESLKFIHNFSISSSIINFQTTSLNKHYRISKVDHKVPNNLNPRPAKKRLETQKYIEVMTSKWRIREKKNIEINQRDERIHKGEKIRDRHNNDTKGP